MGNNNFPLRTSNAHSGQTWLSFTHVCHEDPKRIKVGTSAKCVRGNLNPAFPCDIRSFVSDSYGGINPIQPSMQRCLQLPQPASCQMRPHQKVSDRHMRPNPRPSTIWAVAVALSFYSFDGKCIVPVELWDPGLNLTGSVPKPVVRLHPFPFTPQHLSSIA